MIAGVFEVPAWVLDWFYTFTHSYSAAIALIAVLVMILVTPLNLKSTKGMLEMQRLAPEMRKLRRASWRRQSSTRMMNLYQDQGHPMASFSLCRPYPVFSSVPILHA